MQAEIISLVAMFLNGGSFGPSSGNLLIPDNTKTEGNQYNEGYLFICKICGQKVFAQINLATFFLK